MKTCSICGRKEDLNSEGICIDCSLTKLDTQPVREPEPVKEYHLILDTPLNFHNFVKYFVLPAGALGQLVLFIKELMNMRFFHWLYIVDFIFYIAVIALSVTAFVGFLKWRLYGYHAFKAFLFVLLASRMYGVVLYAVLEMPSEMGRAIAAVLVALIYTILVLVYYKKRKPLFQR